MTHFVEGNTPVARWRRWLPGVVVVVVLGIVALALFLGARALIGSASTSPEPGAPEEATPIVIEEYTPVPVEEKTELDQYGNPIPQRVPVDIGKYPAVKPAEGCSTLTLPRTDPFCSNMSDRALTDRHVANYMLPHAAHVSGSRSIYDREITKDATHWLRQVVATPVEDGGPSLTHEVQFLEILDRWLEDDYSHAHTALEWLRSIIV